MKVIVTFWLFLVGIFSYGSIHIVTSANNSGTGSLKELLINSSEGDTIGFHEDIKEININTSGILIKKSIHLISEHRVNIKRNISDSDIFRIFSIEGSDNIKVTFKNLNISGGYAPNDVYPYDGGGGLRINNPNATVTIYNCIIQENTGEIGERFGQEGTPGASGGGILILEGTVSMFNCLVHSNVAGKGGEAYTGGQGGHGGGIAVLGGALNLVHCTIVNNTSGDKGEDTGGDRGIPGYGGGIYIGDDGKLILINSVLALNNIGEGNIIEGPDLYKSEGAHFNPNSSLIKEFNDLGIILLKCPKCITDGTDPVFTNFNSFDFSLNKFSPCLDAGEIISQFDYNMSTDLAGNKRFVGDYPDMGAYENVSLPEIHVKLDGKEIENNASLDVNSNYLTFYIINTGGTLLQIEQDISSSSTNVNINQPLSKDILPDDSISFTILLNPTSTPFKVTINSNDLDEETFTFIMTNTGLGTNTNSFEVQAWPNPGNGRINVSSNERIKKICLLNIEGKILVEKYPDTFSKDYILDVNVPSGSYFLLIQDERDKINIKQILIE